MKDTSPKTIARAATERIFEAGRNLDDGELEIALLDLLQRDRRRLIALVWQTLEAWRSRRSQGELVGMLALETMLRDAFTAFCRSPKKRESKGGV